MMHRFGCLTAISCSNRLQTFMSLVGRSLPLMQLLRIVQNPSMEFNSILKSPIPQGVVKLLVGLL